ncbi:MAG: AMP-binding protein [Oligoflexales bacterium]|nr:AMP-binding protein [Oligoflexales bacterium]
MLMFCGCSIAFMESVDTAIKNFSEVRPDFFIAVPRIFNKIYDMTNKKIRDKGGLIERMYDSAAVAVKKNNNRIAVTASEEIALFIIDFLVFRKVRKLLGGNLKFAVSASAALDTNISYFMRGVGIPVHVGYGLTETSPVLTQNTPSVWRIGSVGKPIFGVTIKLDKTIEGVDEGEGEIIAYGPNVMKGYLNQPEETKKVIMDDGGFRTGDIGYFDRNGFLYITGRVKEQYKLANGKYVVPGPIEDNLKKSRFVENALVHGESMIKNFCIISVNMAELGRWSAEKALDCPDDKLLVHPETRKLFQGIIDEAQKDFKHYEWIGHFMLTPESWNTDNGLLTQTMKLRRKVVLKRYHAQIATMLQYDGNIHVHEIRGHSKKTG